MNLEQRIDLLVNLGHYVLSGDEGWRASKDRASEANRWFTPEFIELAVGQIAQEYLAEGPLRSWTEKYSLPSENPNPRHVGVIMAGNIPLVGFHDFLCTFITGHRQTIKPSSRDEILIRRLADKLAELDPETRQLVSFADRLKGCEVFIGTGSNNSARYFDYYFGKYPHIIRRNRTSVAILSGEESEEDLGGLADDVNQYFGLGCRSVTKLYVPENYDFIPLLQAFRKYDYLADQHKYRNNYDYNLALLILNKKLYMTNGSILLAEERSLFSPIGVLHYEYYKESGTALSGLKSNPDVQCIVGQGLVPFGRAQRPALDDYADGVDTLQFLLSLTP
ncbi:MAG: acyl-CoA reductase [Bacteroidota bacterium]|nr:acyl-CoA reductase [Bacteroidota bacterium]